MIAEANTTSTESVLFFFFECLLFGVNSSVKYQTSHIILLMKKWSDIFFGLTFAIGLFKHAVSSLQAMSLEVCVIIVLCIFQIEVAVNLPS